VVPQLVDHRLRQVVWPVIKAPRNYITAQLWAGVTATIYQRLHDERAWSTA
jgi:hypothetical protein